MHRDGEAARSNKPPFIDFDDLPAFERICEAAGGRGERVEDPALLPAAMRRALKAVDGGKRAVLNVIARG
jgi:acetolactate synthase-1/2/3 large subunit